MVKLSLTYIWSYIYLLFLKEIGTQTNPPPRANFAAYITQWIIYDAYQEDYENQQREKVMIVVAFFTDSLEKIYTYDQ